MNDNPIPGLSLPGYKEEGVKRMKYKKVLVFSLIVTIIIGTSNYALANINIGDFPDIEGSMNRQAISYLKALGTLKGDGDTGNFRPDSSLTRQEFAVIILRFAELLENDVLANRAGDPIPGIDITVLQSQASDKSLALPQNLPFKDDSNIANWARDSIEKAAVNGWIKGYTNGTFGPMNSLTYPEAITVLIKVLGYEDTLLNGNWPTPYISKAKELGMLESITQTTNKPITRSEMSQLTYNSLFIPRLIKEGTELLIGDPILSSPTQTNDSTLFGFGDMKIFYIGDLDSDGDGYGDKIRTYEEIKTPLGESIEVWRYLKEIKELEDKYIDEGEDSTQRLADLKKLADELRNVIELKNSDGDNKKNPNDDVKDQSADVTGQDTGISSVSRVADLKKLADELVNVYELAQETTIIGGDKIEELMGAKVRVTFNKEGKIFILEVLESSNIE